MRYIEKGACPQGLTRYKRSVGACYYQIPSTEKRELRTSLLQEQGYVCGYCGGGINEHNAVIEHIQCQARHPQLQLEYSNMICSCKGGQDRRSNNRQYPLHCDASKGSRDISISPLNEDCNENFIYDDEGNIHPINLPDAETTIQILNLNNAKLKSRRNAAIDAFRYLDDDIDWEAEINHLYSLKQDGKFVEFCFVLEQYIRNYKMP